MLGNIFMQLIKNLRREIIDIQFYFVTTLICVSVNSTHTMIRYTHSEIGQVFLN